MRCGSPAKRAAGCSTSAMTGTAFPFRPRFATSRPAGKIAAIRSTSAASGVSANCFPFAPPEADRHDRRRADDPASERQRRSLRRHAAGPSVLAVRGAQSVGQLQRQRNDRGGHACADGRCQDGGLRRRPATPAPRWRFSPARRGCFASSSSSAAAKSRSASWPKPSITAPRRCRSRGTSTTPWPAFAKSASGSRSTCATASTRCGSKGRRRSCTGCWSPSIGSRPIGSSFPAATWGTRAPSAKRFTNSSNSA